MIKSTGCCICKQNDKNLEHWLYCCNGIKLVWGGIKKIQNNVIINALLSVSRWKIWKRRNHIRYNKGYFPIRKLVDKSKWELNTTCSYWPGIRSCVF